MSAAVQARQELEAFPSAPESGVRERSGVEYVALIKELRAENARLHQKIDALSVYRRLAYRDELTGLYNRRLFSERLAQEWSCSARHATPLSLILIDLDNFKLINDRDGHKAGDQVLRHFARGMADVCRDIDVPCRIGGDEFAYVLPHTDTGGARTLMQRFSAAMLRAPSAPSSWGRAAVTWSWGIATAPGAARSAQDLFVHADRAMYADKRRRTCERSAG